MLAHPKALKRLSTHSGRLERWLGADKIAQLSHSFRHGGGPGQSWYGPPVNLADVPGSVWIGGDGDFVGDLGRGFFASAADSFQDHIRRLWHEAGKPLYLREPQLNAGFADLADAITRARTGYRQTIRIGVIGKTTNAASCDCWGRNNVFSVQGLIGSAAPGGRAPTSITTGALSFSNPNTGTLHLAGADIGDDTINGSYIIYDRIFDVAKTMNSTATEAVTGLPTRYQSATASADDYAGGNFLFMAVFSTLAATAHNWTVCQYTDEAGNAGATLPLVAGASGQGVDSLDMPTGTWFAPLAIGDIGVKALTQMQCDALVATGTLNFVMGHPIGVLCFPQIPGIIPFDWLTVRSLAPRIFNDAALSFIKTGGIGTDTIDGTLTLVNAP